MLSPLPSSDDRAHPALGDDRIAPTALMLGDPARIAMLWAVSDGRALPAGELAAAANLRPSAASAHLEKLVHAGLLQCERQGRHRYFRLGNPHIVRAMEALAAATPLVSQRASRPRPHSQPTQALRSARTCYDHVAGGFGVALTSRFLALGAIRQDDGHFALGDQCTKVFGLLRIDLDALHAQSAHSRRALVRTCLDWSERQYHVAGLLGAAVGQSLLQLGWISRVPGSRALKITNEGRRALQRELGLRVY